MKPKIKKHDGWWVLYHLTSGGYESWVFFHSFGEAKACLIERYSTGLVQR